MVDSGKVTSTLLGIRMFDATEQNMEDILCLICNYTTNSQKNLIYHIVRQHRNDSNFHVICTFPHCFIVQDPGVPLKVIFLDNTDKE